MKTPPCPNLPRPPDIIRAQCPEVKATADGMYPFYGYPYYLPFMSDYLWKFNRALNINFPWMYYDMRYGALYFDDDRTTDCGEMKFDATNLTMNICGTEYDSAVTTVTSISADDIDPSNVIRVGQDCDPGATREDAWADYRDDPIYDTWYLRTDERMVGRYVTYGSNLPGQDCPGSGYIGIGTKFYVNFDTSTASENPSSALIRFYFNDALYFDDPVEPTLRIYSQNWGDAVDTGDWGNGSLESSRTILESEEGDYIEMAVGTDTLNIGGDSKYKFSMACVDDGSIPTIDQKGTGMKVGTVQLKLTYLAGWQ